jgi:CRP-like cAMP-binding protein
VGAASVVGEVCEECKIVSISVLTKSIYKDAVLSLLKVLEHLHPLEDGVKDFFFRHCKIKRYKKGDFLLQPGKICDSYYYIYEGLVRSYVNYDDKEITTWVSAKGEIITSIYSFRSKSPSIEYIQVIRNSLLLQLDASDIDQLYRTFSSYNIIGRKLLEHYYADAEVRALITRMPTAELKYQLFVEKFPHILTLIPQKYIASFLGIRQETLSRLVREYK